MGWVFRVGKRYQITIRALAPILNIKTGDEVEAILKNGDLVLRKKESEENGKKR